MPDRTAQEVKRLMGTDTPVTLGDVTYRPEEISAQILKWLKAAAEARLGAGSVRDVVISVPARFENPAREATKRAAELAGLNVLRLINEPTAAALSYGLDRLEDQKKVLVFDFGGGTLDVTVLEMFEGVLDVKTSVGDDRLGGKDVDEILIAHFRDEFRKQHGRETDPDNLKARARLKEAAEDAKKQLSAMPWVITDLPFLDGPDGIENLTLTRSHFEMLVSELVDRAMTLVDAALARAKLTYADIDVILPVGGSSRIPIFREELEKRWGKSLQEYDNPDEAVARGAAIMAGVSKDVFSDEGIIILDNTPHRLGVAVLREIGPGQYVDNHFSEIIPKDDKLPALRNDDFTTVHDDQESILIRIYEANTESNRCEEHRLIAELPMQDIPPAPAGYPIRIEFQYTADGTLDVRAFCREAPDVKIDHRLHVVGRGTPTAPPRSLNDLWRDPETERKYAPLLDQARQAEQAHPKAADRVRAAADALRGAILSQDSAEMERRADALTDVLFDLS